MAALKSKLLLDFSRAPGDVLMMTGLVRDLKLTYQDRFQIGVSTQFPAIWRHNPYICKLDPHDKNVQVVRLGGDSKEAADSMGIGWSRAGAFGGQKMHYATVFHRAFQHHTGLSVPVLKPHGDLHLSEEEKAKPNIDGRYWIIVPGGKTDMTTKWWSLAGYQEVVDKLRARGFRFVQEGATKPMHVHPPLRDVLNLVGRTSVRDLIRNIWHAEGVICGCTFQMHIAGALQKPCVVLLGGREEPWYEAYVNDFGAFPETSSPIQVPHRVLHTLGQLDCCQHAGCWTRRVEPLPDRHSTYNESLCKQPVRTASQTLPACMQMITADHVVEAVMSYYEDTMPPETIVSRDDVYVPPTAAPKMPSLPELLQLTELQSVKQSPPIKPAAATATPRKSTDTARSDVGFDHPAIGGKITICVLLHGDEHHLHRRCLRSICETVPETRVELRVFCNQTGHETENLLRTFPVAFADVDRERRRKYEAMRLAFHDEERPIATPWVVWFDDVAFVRQHNWLTALIGIIANQDPSQKVGAVGRKMTHRLGAVGKDPVKWFRNGSWWQNRHLQTRHGAEAANGDHIHFLSPNFFAVSRAAIRDCSIPDSRIRQNGGGIVIGEQLHQRGYKLKAFDENSQFVVEQDLRRGHFEKYPWT